jgi:transcriptional regulator with PAS, ATPase and Fis domain
MHTATAREEVSAPALTITEGLAELVQAFASRNVTAARATLKRQNQTYEYMVDDKQPGIQRHIEGRFTNIQIVVSCLSPMSAELNAELQAITTTAATAAQHWTEPVNRPTLVQPSLTDRQMIGISAEMKELDADISRAARSSHVVLIVGESGTGKTTAAALIHRRSPRAAKTFVDINCAALPETLIESELFGYEKGAFTGAIATKKGLFELAEEGTLFLDEIGEMKLELQAKLLKAIEQQKIRRLGGTKDIQCNVRIVAASARNLQQMVSEGKFRDDLYYRLAVLEVPIAPLRQRREDIALLVHDRLVYEQQLASLPIPFEIEDKALTELAVYDWPGNIRQLHNVLSRLATRTDEGMPITAAAARSEIARFQPETSNNHCAVASERAVLLPADCRMLLQGESMQDFINRLKRTVIESVRNSTGSMTHAANRLQYDRTALQKLFARLIANDNASKERTDRESALAA